MKQMFVVLSDDNRYTPRAAGAYDTIEQAYRAAEAHSRLCDDDLVFYVLPVTLCTEEDVISLERQADAITPLHVEEETDEDHMYDAEEFRIAHRR